MRYVALATITVALVTVFAFAFLFSQHERRISFPNARNDTMLRGLRSCCRHPLARPTRSSWGRERGGRLDEHIERWKAPAASGDDVEIRDYSVSACTLVLAYIPKERLCFGLGGSLWFHLAQELNGEPSMEASRWMFNTYPEDIHAWLNAKGGLEKMPAQNFWNLVPVRALADGLSKLR